MSTVKTTYNDPPSAAKRSRPTALGSCSANVSIPNANIIYAVAGLAIFGAFTVFDFTGCAGQVLTAPS